MQKQTLDQQEVEWQFEASDLDLVESWLEEHPSASSLAVVREATKELLDTYYDTEDWRFYRAGYALRVRRDGESLEATMKSLTPAEGALRQRREICEPLESSLVTPKGTGGPVGERVRKVAGARDLRPLFEVRTRRRIFALRPERPSADRVVEDASGNIRRYGTETTLGEVSLDETVISADGGAATRLNRIEVEVASDADLEEFVGELREALELRPTETSKFRSGLAAAGLEPEAAPDLGPTEVDASMSAAEVAFAVLRRHFAVMLANEPGVRLGEDPEDLHDMRVATRRLRATLKLYSDALPKRAERYERDLRYVANALGEVRDLDVHLERLAGEASRDGEILQEVIAVLKENRVGARRNMLQTLDSDRYERFVSSFSGTLRRGRSPAPTRPILEAAPELVRRRYRKVRRAADRLAGDSSPEEFHDLRKKGRRLRYALEPLQGIYGKPAEKMIKLLKEIQDDLGEHQDFVVAMELMEELGSDGDLPPRTVFSMGSMAGRYTRDAAKMREDFLGSKPLRALRRGSPWKKLRKEMKGKAGG
jgi:triphosphatase